MTSPSATSTATAMPSTTPRKAVANRATSQTAKSGRLTCQGVAGRRVGRGKRAGHAWAIAK